MRVTASIDVRPAFLPIFADDAPRFQVVVAHRRAGKTTAALQKLIAEALKIKKPNGRFAFIAPLRIQAKTAAWDMARRMACTLPGTQVNESELRLDLANGSRIQLHGSDNPDSLRGSYLDGCVIDEIANVDPRTWIEVVRPMLSDRLGWMVAIGTPAGRNAFADMYDRAATEPGWGRLFLPASETGIVDPDELESAKRDMSPEAFAQEYMLSWTAAIRGAYYGQLMEQAEADGRICDLPIVQTAWTATAWDLGVRDSTAIWIIQADGPWWNAIDYIESSGVGLDWYVGKLREKGYRFDQHIAPPDINVSELGTGRTRLEIARELGVDFSVCRGHRVDDGIQAVRTLLPRMRFDRVRCARGIQALQLYRAEWDPRLSALRSNPLHDQWSHGSDALRYMAMADLGRGASTYDDPGISPNTGRAYTRGRESTDGRYRRAQR